MTTEKNIGKMMEMLTIASVRDTLGKYYEARGKEVHILNYPIFTDYCKESKSAGPSVHCHNYLYSWIRHYKPKEVLELGTGKSTIAMAIAMQENGFGQITSMEDNAKWFNTAQELMPQGLEPYIDLRMSPISTYKGGYHYERVPLRPYEMAFIDGPTPQPNHDYLWVLDYCYPTTLGILDKRHQTLKSFIKFFGVENITKIQKAQIRLIDPKEYTGEPIFNQ